MLLAGTDLTLEAALAALARERPLFHSEADFQFALAWEIKTLRPAMNVRLERRMGDRTYLDVELSTPAGWTGLELQFVRRTLTATIHDDEFRLSRGAPDVERHAIVKDIARLECMIRERGANANGGVVVLSAEPSLWLAPTTEAADHAFRIHEGAHLAGLRQWGAEAGLGTTRGRRPVDLFGAYDLRWQRFASEPVDLRLLIVDVLARDDAS